LRAEQLGAQACDFCDCRCDVCDAGGRDLLVEIRQVGRGGLEPLARGEGPLGVQSLQLASNLECGHFVPASLPDEVMLGRGGEPLYGAPPQQNPKTFPAAPCVARLLGLGF
jgi:hypothetical protein